MGARSSPTTEYADELIHRAEEKAKAFFALPEEVKRKYLIAGGGGARGYTPFGIETAKGHKAHDLKEFRTLVAIWPAGHKFRDHMPDNLWPAEVATFKDASRSCSQLRSGPASRP